MYDMVLVFPIIMSSEGEIMCVISAMHHTECLSLDSAISDITLWPLDIYKILFLRLFPFLTSTRIIIIAAWSCWLVNNSSGLTAAECWRRHEDMWLAGALGTISDLQHSERGQCGDGNVVMSKICWN